MSFEVRVDGALEGRVRLGVLTLESVAVRSSDPAVDAEVDAYCAELAERYGGGRSADVPGAADARTA